MSLVSISYRTNQYQQSVYQFETNPRGKRPKPIYLKPLTPGSRSFSLDFGAPDGRHPDQFGCSLSLPFP